MLSVKERIKDGDIDAYKSYIPNRSPLIGKIVDETIKGYEGKIIIIPLRDFFDDFRKQNINPKTVFKKGMCIKIFGEWEDICSFTAKYGLP